MKATLFRCGRCGKRYANPRTHVCVTRADRARKPGRTRLAPQASRTCPQCGKPYANPLTHTCTVKSGFRARKAAQDRQRARSKASAERARQRTAAKARDAAARQRQRAAVKAAVERERQNRRAAVRAAVTRERQRATTARTAARPSPRPGSGPRADTHDYRECFYASQPDRGRARHDCERFPCRVYHEGHEHGYADGYPKGHAVGYAEGYAKGRRDGYAQGFPDGIAACPRDHRG